MVQRKKYMFPITDIFFGCAGAGIPREPAHAPDVRCCRPGEPLASTSAVDGRAHDGTAPPVP